MYLGRYSKAKEQASRNGSTVVDISITPVVDISITPVVDISITPPSIKLVSLSLVTYRL